MSAQEREKFPYSRLEGRIQLTGKIPRRCTGGSCGCVMTKGVATVRSSRKPPLSPEEKATLR